MFPPDAGVTHLTALLLYLVAFVLWMASLLSGVRGPRGGWASGAATAAVAFHGLALAGYVLRYSELPIVGLGPALSLLAFLLGLGVVGVAFRGEAARVGIILVPFIAFLQGTALSVGIAPAPGDSGLQGAWFTLHVVLSLLGFQGLTLATAAGLLYLVQFHELRTKRLGKLFHFLPPLATLEALTTTGLRIGAAVMTLGLLAGWGWAGRYEGGVNWANPKIAWAVLSWVALVTPLVLRRWGGATGHRVALFTVGGFVLVVAVYLALRLAPAAGPGFL